MHCPSSGAADNAKISATYHCETHTSTKPQGPTDEASGKCLACGWTTSAHGFVTRDVTNPGRVYITSPPCFDDGQISSQCAEDNLDAVLQRTCVRAMTCEVCPGSAGPFLFGDVVSGYTYVYAFDIADIESRGGTRRYAVLLFSYSRGPLLNAWDFATSVIFHMITDLRQAVYCRLTFLH